MKNVAKKKKDSCTLFFCTSSESLVCIHELFSKKIVTSMSRGKDRNGVTEFCLWVWIRHSRAGPKGQGWKLKGTNEILEAIKLADKHKVEKIYL